MIEQLFVGEERIFNNQDETEFMKLVSHVVTSIFKGFDEAEQW